MQQTGRWVARLRCGTAGGARRRRREQRKGSGGSDGGNGRASGSIAEKRILPEVLREIDEGRSLARIVVEKVKPARKD
eukprot:2019344-Pleurochrysis_carterae.AAC.1